MHVYALVTLLLSTSVATVLAHPPTSNDKHEERMFSEAELQDRQHAAVKRHVQARNCEREVHEFQMERMRKRQVEVEKRAQVSTVPVAKVTAGGKAPHFKGLQNTTCVTAPEVTEGPYYIHNELVRQNVVDSQPGVPLKLDIGLIDTRTCKPITDPSFFVELWHANANGDYAGFVSQSSTTASASNGGSPSNATMPSGGAPSGGAPSGGAGPSGAAPSGNGTAPSGAAPSGGGAAPSGTMPSGGGAGGNDTQSGGMSVATTDQQTFHRGSWPVSSGGVVEFDTKFPGYYNGRTIHAHIMVHSNATVFSNGTLYSSAGSVRHIGQLFFDDTITAAVLATSPYNATRGFNRTTNAEDSIFAQENADGNNAFVQITRLGRSVSDGLLGYITVGVDTEFVGSIVSTNYWVGSSLSAGSSSSATSGFATSRTHKTSSTSKATKTTPHHSSTQHHATTTHRHTSTHRHTTHHKHHHTKTHHSSKHHTTSKHHKTTSKHN